MAVNRFLRYSRSRGGLLPYLPRFPLNSETVAHTRWRNSRKHFSTRPGSHVANCIRIRFRSNVSRYSPRFIHRYRQRISLRISPPLSPGILTKGKDQTEFNNRGRGEKAAIDLPFSLSRLILSPFQQRIYINFQRLAAIISSPGFSKHDQHHGRKQGQLLK